MCDFVGRKLTHVNKITMLIYLCKNLIQLQFNHAA